MSIAGLSISDHPIGGQTATVSTKTNKPPPKRRAVAKADTIAEPEAR